MARKAIIRSSNDYYHVTARSNNREFWYLPLDAIWNVFMKELSTLQDEYKIVIPAFVLMNNHFHLLLLTPNEDIDRIMYFFMKRTTREIQKLSGRINKIFGGRYKGSIIQDYSYLVNVYKYICLNPVKAGIISKAEFYPYSTLFYKYHSSLQTPIQLHNIFLSLAFNEFRNLGEVNWINLGFSSDESKSIQTGLKKSTFDFAKDNSTGKKIIPSFPPSK